MDREILKYLGFIITPNGKEFKFGEYKPYIKRSEDNPRDYHKSSFQTEVENNEEWQKLNLPIEKGIDITHATPLLASLGIIVGLNKTAGTFEPGIPTILFVVPNALTDEQIEKLLNKKEELLLFDKDLSYIRVINHEGKTVDRLDYISNYYKKYVIPEIENLPKRV